MKDPLAGGIKSFRCALENIAKAGNIGREL